MRTGGHLKNVCWRARGIRAREDDGGGRGRSHHALAAAAGICASTASGHRPAQPPSLAASLLAEGQRRVTVIRAARPDEPRPGPLAARHLTRRSRRRRRLLASGQVRCCRCGHRVGCARGLRSAARPAHVHPCNGVAVLGYAAYGARGEKNLDVLGIPTTLSRRTGGRGLANAIFRADFRGGARRPEKRNCLISPSSLDSRLGARDEAAPGRVREPPASRETTTERRTCSGRSRHARCRADSALGVGHTQRQSQSHSAIICDLHVMLMWLIGCRPRPGRMSCARRVAPPPLPVPKVQPREPGAAYINTSHTRESRLEYTHSHHAFPFAVDAYARPAVKQAKQ